MKVVVVITMVDRRWVLGGALMSFVDLLLLLATRVA